MGRALCTRVIISTTYGVWAWWGQILGFSIDFRRRPYNTLALPWWFFSCVPRFHMFNTCHATACKCRIFVEHLSYAYTRALLIGGVSVCLPVCHIDSKLISVGSRSFFLPSPCMDYRLFYDHIACHRRQGNNHYRASNDTEVGKNGGYRRFSTHWSKICDFSPFLEISRYVSKTIEDRQTATMED